CARGLNNWSDVGDNSLDVW
nr:immunoglobulin heavy chain junction region [Macaca mulatta]MOY21062.1 immunoglobulin heavy chain junction region [Macaca mulatta]MOY21376.1 immunoglobulin heavy chain junction region [Macaca mulatta]MOY21675.1 immunoglobulin heavy chain junction region [Macaca mulatta]MOY22345.1 immunoglobulin heavy chain junction region [Macaca mulatta]